jgi:hypothetical protein
MRLPKKNILVLCLSLATVIICFSQENDYKKITGSITAKVKRITGYTYNISGSDVNRQIIEDSLKALKDPYFKQRIRDPYHTLSGCFIFLAADYADTYFTRPKGFVGIYNIKLDSIIWNSAPLSDDFSSGALGLVDATGELNRDGKVEIIIGQAIGALANTHQLWIFNWDGKDGKLITQLDTYGESSVLYWGDDYDLDDIDNDGIYEIRGMDSEYNKTLMYSWNGHLYGDWGKLSKYLLKGKKK